MKKGILFAMFLGGLFAANAQTATAQTSTTLNVRLHPIQTIVVNPAQNEVNLDYVTAADYAKGVSSDQENHLVIYSTGAFAVTVNSLTDQLTNSAFAGDNINSSDITITPSAGTSKPLAGATVTPAALSSTAKEVISSSIGANNATFNINYSAKGDNDSYINKYHNVQNPTVYTTVVTYTIAAK
ncbi:hypothetical protein [Chryseobacterium sp. MDT2-18]|uniref:hypothetical protein n=1 Tax=Chryseobacterium sp. MDT2-18 TaxID=1259136 RepID=UPI002782BAB1|nr:hypothetical protein [Chryseobacterium sp. MDT2-18]MDQ0477955.1 hypothetical protein [Chryseobacterium sp. MDT2-18]